MKNIKKKIELLCPAGDLERLKTAVVFGADAVYCGLPEWSLRNPREITFTLETLQEGIEFAHKRGVKVYLTFNIFPHESQLADLEKEIKKLKKLEIDGIIVSDLGVLALIKKYLPKISIHISTQANTLNSEAILQWAKLGAERIVLARELTLEEIGNIKKKLEIGNCPSVLSSGSKEKLEIECFGHGAMCIAYSGRCLLSKYFTGREANLGDCAQSCRWKYKIKKHPSTSLGTKKIEEQSFLEEETRPEDLLEIQEDPNGTYIMNSKELCALDIIDQFIEAGIDSLKIEGRAKTVYYLATVTRAYRKAIDAYYNSKQISNKQVSSKKLDKEKIEKDFRTLINELGGELNLIQNRGYSHGFLLSKCGYEQEYDNAAFKPPVMFVGIALESKNGATMVEVKNKFKIGEEVEIVTPDEIIKTKILKIIDEKNNSIEEILTPQEKVWVSLESGIKNQESRIPERSILRRKIK